MLARRTNLLVVVLCLLWVGCAPPSDMIQEPRLPTCREVVDLDGRPRSMDVQWFAPAAGSDRRSHAEWCGTVGPLVIEPEPSGPSNVGQRFSAAEGDVGQRSSDAEADVGQRFSAAETDGTQPFIVGGNEIAIVSWNVHVGGGDVLAFVRRLRSGEWSNGRAVTHFVLLLQEVFRRGPAVPAPLGSSPPIPGPIAPSLPDGTRLDVVKAAQQLGLSLFYAPSMRNGRSALDDNEDRGNAILATFPLSDFQVIELPFERQRRVPVAATVHIAPPSGPALALRVCSAHLDNRVTHRRLYVFAPPGRTRQTKGLLDALPAGEPLVLGGDFNTWLGEAEGTLRQLRRVFPDTPPGTGATFGAARLDYLFFRLPAGWRSEWRVLDQSFGSDHRPVLGWLRAAEPAPRDDRH